MSDYNSILSAASQLPVGDRLRLIDELAAGVPDDQPPQLSVEWMEEIARRSAEVDAGTAELRSWEEVRKSLFKDHGLASAD